MKKRLLGFACLFLIFATSCEKEITREDEEKKLAAMYKEIQTLAESVACTDDSEWTFTGLGAKPCGGVTGHIAYSTTIDTVDFLKKTEEYTKATASFNQKWGIMSDCSITREPSGVICEDGKAKLVYNNFEIIEK